MQYFNIFIPGTETTAKHSANTFIYCLNIANVRVKPFLYTFIQKFTRAFDLKVKKQ